MPAAFLEYSSWLLGIKMSERTLVNKCIVNNKTLLYDVNKALLSLPFTRAEVKDAMWDIDGEKAPRPDGFGSAV